MNPLLFLVVPLASFLPFSALAQPHADHYGAVPATPKTRTEVITILPPPTVPTPGPTIILRTRPDGRTTVTVCSVVAGVSVLCTRR